MSEFSRYGQRRRRASARASRIYILFGVVGLILVCLTVACIATIFGISNAFAADIDRLTGLPGKPEKFVPLTVEVMGVVLYEEFDCNQDPIKDPAAHNALGFWMTSDPNTITTTLTVHSFDARNLVVGYSLVEVGDVTLTNTWSCYFNGEIFSSYRWQLLSQILPAYDADVFEDGSLDYHYVNIGDPTYTPMPTYTSTATGTPEPTPTVTQTPLPETLYVFDYNVNGGEDGFGKHITTTHGATLLGTVYVYSEDVEYVTFNISPVLETWTFGANQDTCVWADFQDSTRSVTCKVELLDTAYEAYVDVPEGYVVGTMEFEVDLIVEPNLGIESGLLYITNPQGPTPTPTVTPTPPPGFVLEFNANDGVNNGQHITTTLQTALTGVAYNYSDEINTVIFTFWPVDPAWTYGNTEGIVCYWEVTDSSQVAACDIDNGEFVEVWVNVPENFVIGTMQFHLNALANTYEVHDAWVYITDPATAFQVYLPILIKP